MKKLVVYVHGKGGTAEESRHYKKLFPDCDVIGFDYKSTKPWEAEKEFADYYDFVSDGYDSVVWVANSIGAFFSMVGLSEKKISKALFISPVVNMEKLIAKLMNWANVTEEELRAQEEIATNFGETLSWQYLCYVRNNPVVWKISTCILYGANDNLTSYETVCDFAKQTGATVTIMSDGEHWFHTDKQMAFLDDWVKRSTR